MTDQAQQDSYHFVWQDHESFVAFMEAAGPGCQALGQELPDGRYMAMLDPVTARYARSLLSQD